MRWWPGVVPGVMVILASRAGFAGVHARFEPTDLELEDSGVTEIDMQFGPVKGPQAPRLVGPDFEIDLGILPGFELDLDGALGAEGAGNKRFFDHAAVDNLWLSAKLGLYGSHELSTSWALGVQVGPKLPTSIGSSGLGVEGILLVGRRVGPLHLIFNAGGLVDPHADNTARPVGVEGGVDLELELVQDKWSLLGELGGIWYRSDDPSQLAATFGVQWSKNERLDFSIVGLVGFLSGSDAYGVLFGVSPKFALW